MSENPNWTEPCAPNFWGFCLLKLHVVQSFCLSNKNVQRAHLKSNIASHFHDECMKTYDQNYKRTPPTTKNVVMWWWMELHVGSLFSDVNWVWWGYLDLFGLCADAKTWTPEQFLNKLTYDDLCVYHHVHWVSYNMSHLIVERIIIATAMWTLDKGFVTANEHTWSHCTWWKQNRSLQIIY